MSNQDPTRFIKPPVLTPPEDAVHPDEIRIRRRAALERARQNGVHTLKTDEGRWLGAQARLGAETGTHEIPDVAAHRAAMAAQPAEQSPEQARRVA